MPVTPNIAMNIPPIGSNNWGAPLNFNFSLLDQIFGGSKGVPGLLITGNMSVTGTITAGQFSGLDGAFFLTSALFNQPNGIPGLNGAGLIPASLLPTTSMTLADTTNGNKYSLTMVNGNLTVTQL